MGAYKRTFRKKYYLACFEFRTSIPEEWLDGKIIDVVYIFDERN